MVAKTADIELWNEITSLSPYVYGVLASVRVLATGQIVRRLSCAVCRRVREGVHALQRLPTDSQTDPHRRLRPRRPVRSRLQRGAALRHGPVHRIRQSATLCTVV